MKKKMLLAQKCGMTLRFGEKGQLIPCTVLKVEPAVVVQKKSREKEGYDALQLGSREVPKEKKSLFKGKKPLKGHYAKAGLALRRVLFEVAAEELGQYNEGQLLDLSWFENTEYFDVSGKTKGRGFQGVMRRWGFQGGPASHGSKFHRSAGSTGSLGFSRSPKGEKRPGRMGNRRVSMQNLRRIHWDHQKGILLLRGAVPGCKGGFVMISPAIKRP